MGTETKSGRCKCTPAKLPPHKITVIIVNVCMYNRTEQNIQRDEEIHYRTIRGTFGGKSAFDV